MSGLSISPENDFVRELKSGEKPRLRERIVPLGAVTLAFDSQWVRARLAKSRRRLQSTIQHKPVSSLILTGNGPGLNNTHWGELDNHDVMVSNYAHLSPELISRATYWCVVNPFVAAQKPEMFEDHPSITKFIPYWLAAWLKVDDNTILLPGSGDPEFSSAITNSVSVRSTVSYFGLQIAAFLGYRRVALIGFDHYYDQPDDAAEGDLLEAGICDPNHFDNSYFGGKLWQAADTFRMEHVYALARIAYEDEGKEIVNCSVPTNLTIFPRQPLASVLAAPDTPPLRIPSSNLRQKLSTLARWLVTEDRGAGYRAVVSAAAVTTAFALSGMLWTVSVTLGVVSGGAVVAWLYSTRRREQIQREHQFRLLSILRASDASRRSSKPLSPPPRSRT